MTADRSSLTADRAGRTMKTPSRRLPHLLAGGTAANWFGLLARRGGVSRRNLGRALGISGGVLLGIPFRAYESLRYARRLRATVLDPEPVFIIGHWQAGHSPVHYLMSCDRQFGYTSTVHCALPACFLTLEPVVTRFLESRLPQNRRVDTLPTGLRAPQGDDMALAGLSEFSFYHAYSFPKAAEATFRRGVLLDGVPRRTVRRWQATYRRFLKRVALETGANRLLVRNASHTGRIPELLEMFPRAKFVHVYRNPYRIYAALAERWKALLELWALQEYDLGHMQELTLQFFELLMRKFLNDKQQIPAGNLVEVRFEDFEADPLAVAGEVYDRLGLLGFGDAHEWMQAWLEANPGSVAGETDLNGHDRRRVADRWGFAFDEWNYSRTENH